MTLNPLFTRSVADDVMDELGVSTGPGFGCMSPDLRIRRRERKMQVRLELVKGKRRVY